MSKLLLSCFRTLAAASVIALAVVRPAAAVDWTDIWWNASESGQGYNFIQSDNFIFVTFFVYANNQQPTWYTAQLTVDSNGVWSGKLYVTTGSYFGGTWIPGQRTTTEVGTATFTPNTSYSGTLTYNVT